MIGSFQFASTPHIFFRNGKLNDLASIIRKYGASTLLLTGKQSFLKSERGNKFFDDLSRQGVGIEHLVISSEPSPEDIDNTVKTVGQTRIPVVVSIGGGSVIDAGKAISAMLYRSESVMDFLEGVGTKQHPGTKIPFIAVPTTSGTGSEATKNAVISRTGIGGFKRSLRHDNFVPDMAIIDPELTLHCPPEITAASGMDCFTQLVESFLSDKASEYSDALAVEGLKALKGSLEKAYSSGSDISARTGMSFASLTSGICLANAGLGAVHGFASSIGGRYDIPHGVICGTLMAAANEINVRKLRERNEYQPALRKYELLGRMFSTEEGKSQDYYIDRFIDYLYELTWKLDLPGLRTAGISEESIQGICAETECKNNPVKLNPEDLEEILRKRFI